MQCSNKYTVTSRNKSSNVKCCSWGCYNLYRKGRPRIGYRYSHGYKYIFLPTHPDSAKAGYIAEHRLVGEQKMGRRLLPTEIVHHVNAIKTDNRPENILVCTRREHNLIDEAIIAGKKRRDEESRIPVAQKTIDGLLLKVWESRTEAAEYFKCSISCISQAAREERKSHGFLWSNSI